MLINNEISAYKMGGKGYQLSRMKNHFPIPPFISIMFDDLSEIKEQSNQAIILEKVKELDCSLYAVRSSATCEDSEEASFAGMFSTHLNVALDDVIDTIISVLKSIDNDRVKKYCALKSINYDSVKMRIVVQKQISSRISGVCFTNNNENPGKIVIEGILGLGEMLVSGKVTPDTCIVDRKTMQVEGYNIGYQDIFLGDIYMQEDNKLFDKQELPFYLRNIRKISNDELLEIAKMAIEIESKLGFDSADIEWAYENDKLYIIQARPYTGYRKDA